MAKSPAPTAVASRPERPPKPKPVKLVKVRFTGAANLLLEHAGKRHTFQPGRTHVLDAEVWAALQADATIGPVVANALALGDMTVVR